VLPAVDEPEVVFEPLVLPLPDDLEPRARLPRPEPDVLLPRPEPEVMLPLVLPEVEPMVEPDVVPIEPEVEPIVEPAVVPVVVLPEVVPIVVLPEVVPIVVLPLVEPAVVPVVVWAKAVFEISPRPSTKAAARSGQEICLSILREKKKSGKRKKGNAMLIGP